MTAQATSMARREADAGAPVALELAEEGDFRTE
jgi:hypothetical protein